MKRGLLGVAALLGFGMAGCHKCDLCCNVGGPCGAYSAAGRGGPVFSESAPVESQQAPTVPQNTTGAPSKPTGWRAAPSWR